MDNEKIIQYGSLKGKAGFLIGIYFAHKQTGQYIEKEKTLNKANELMVEITNLEKTLNAQEKLLLKKNLRKMESICSKIQEVYQS